MVAPPPTLRVQHFIPSLGGGGAERQLRQLAPLLVQRGVAVSIVSRLTDVDVTTLEAAGVACHPLRARGNHNPLLLAEAVRAIQSFEPDLVQTWLPQMDIVGGLAARLAGVPYVLSERSSARAYALTAKNRIRRLVGRGAAAIIANSRDGMAVWRDHPDVFLIPNGVDIAAIAEVPAGALCGMPALRGRFVVITIARLAAEKQLDLLIRAAADARRSAPEILVILLGEGEEEGRLRNLVRQLDADDHVCFAGYQKNVWQWLKSAGLFASVSAFEGHPNAVLEAAAAGIPTLLSDIPMHRNCMGDAALYVDSGDVGAVAAGLVELITNGQERARLAALGRSKVEASTIQAAADRYAEIYREISR